ncbi:MAG: AMP-binding protein [Casimicrobiaceae bacterium]
MTTLPSTVRALVENAATRWPEAVYAVSTEDDELITFGELSRSCCTVAALLHAHGARPGDTLSVVMPNGLQTVRLLLGAMYAGLVVNPVNLLSQPAQMRYVLAHSDCKVIYAAPVWEDRVRGMLSALDRPIALIVVDPDAPQVPEAARTSTMPNTSGPAPDAVTLLMYTSGTTGVPKGVMLTQSNLVANAQAICTEHALAQDDRVLAVLPLYHLNAFVVTMLAPLASGGSLALAPRFSAARFWEQAAQTQCSWINVVPTIISYLLEGAIPSRNQTGHIRFCRSASAALAPEHHRAFEHAFGINIIETMGLTETAAPAFSNPLEKEKRRIGSVGRASGCEARVFDTNLREAADGSTGELVIRGPNVMRGYYKNDTATQASFTCDGWLRTGDLGHRESDGFFFVTGRIKELIIKGGENIAPREIDEALLAHPGVLEAAAVGFPDHHYGQEIIACVVLRKGAQCGEDELRNFCTNHLGRYKTPKRIHFVSELPRGPSGKVQRLKLLELLE